MQGNLLAGQSKLRKNLYFNFLLFYFIIVSGYFAAGSLFYFFFIEDWTLRALILLAFSLGANYFVLFIRGESLWFHFGLRFTGYTFKHFAEGLIIAFLLFLPIFIILGFYGIRLSPSGSLLHVPGYFLLLWIFATNEEIIFRGCVFQLFSERRSVAGSVFIFSLIFAFAHIFNPNISLISLLNLFLAGVALSLAYVQTKSLWLAIGLHTGWNFFQLVLLGSSISGINFFQPLLETKIGTLPKILFGGPFGIEGGIITTFLLIIMIAIIAKRYKPIPELQARKFRELFAPPEGFNLQKYLSNPRRIMPIPGMKSTEEANTLE